MLALPSPIIEEGAKMSNKAIIGSLVLLALLYCLFFMAVGEAIDTEFQMQDKITEHYLGR